MNRLTSALYSGIMRVTSKRSERGATAVEYGLLVALIAAVIIAVVVTLGSDIKAAFTGVESQLPAGAAPSASPTP